MIPNRQVLETLEGSDVGAYQEPAITRDDADVVATSESRFRSHCDDAGKVVWIPGNESIELTQTATVRATIASDRSKLSAGSPGSGSSGALLWTRERGKNSHAWDGGNGRGLLQLRGSGRLTGLRYRGPYYSHYSNSEYPGYIPLDSGDASERQRKREQRYARGAKVHSSNVEIDNCEVYGWPVSAIQMGSRGSGAYSPDIHHIYGHDCMMVGFGYVVDVMRGHPHIHHSYFNATRHSIDGFGYANGGYKLEDCVFGPSTYSHAVDMHALAENGYSGNWTAGGRMEIRRNTFLYRKDIRGRNQECVVIRGEPSDRCLVENNRFAHPEPPAKNPGNSSPGYAWRQVNVQNASSVSTDSNGYTRNFIRRNNEFGLSIDELLAPYGGEIEVDVEEPRLATQIPNRKGKAAACRGLSEVIR